MARLGAWAALALLTLYLVFFGGGWFGLYVVQLRIGSVVLAGIVLAVWTIVAIRRPEWRPKSAFLPAIGACLASMAISTANSRFPRLSIEYLAYGIILAALYLLLVRILAQPWFRARMATLATALAIVIGLLFFALIFSHWITWWGLVGRLTVPPLRPEFESLTFGNPAAVMTMSVLLTATAAAAVGVTTRGRAAITVTLALIAGLATILSGARAGWLAVAVAVVVTVAAWLATGEGRMQARMLGRQRAASRLGRMGLAFAAAAAGVVAVTFGPGILTRATAGGEDQRLGFFTAAIRMFQESPLFGTGIGTWVAQRTNYTDPPSPDYYIPHAHNIYLQTLAEQGIVGALAGIVVAVTAARLMWRAARLPTQRPWVLASVFVAAFFAVIHLLDMYVNLPSVLFAFALPLAWLDATTDPDPMADTATAPSWVAGLAWTGSAIALVVAVVLLWNVEQAASAHSNAYVMANQGRWTDSTLPASLAVEQDPDIPAYQVTYGLGLARAGKHAEAAAAFRKAVAVDGLPESWLNLAAEEHLLGHDSDAVSAWDQAMRVGYQRAAISFAAGALALEFGEKDRATRALIGAVSSVPSLAADPWWSGSPERQMMFADVIDGAIDAVPASGWEIALMAGDPDRALELADEPGVDSELAQTVIEAWSNTPVTTDDARQAILDRCDEQPFDAAALGWCARLSARAGETDRANDYRRRAFTLAYDLQVAELRVSTEPLVGRTVEGGIASFYGTYTYRRPTPWDLLVPSLAHLTYT